MIPLEHNQWRIAMKEETGKHQWTQRTEDGHTHILKSDNLTDIIRAAIRSYIGEEFFEEGGAFDIQELEDKWLRITLTFPDGYEHPTDGCGIAADLDVSLAGKGWYECRDSGEEGRGKVFWWIVRHKHGPLV